jgi:hypothetical protein
MPLEPVHALPILDIVGILSLITLSFLLYKAYRVSLNKLFLSFLLGFALLSVGEFGRLILFIAIIFSRRPSFLLFFLNHSLALFSQILEVLGLLVIALGYTLEVFGKGQASALIVAFQERRFLMNPFLLGNVLSASLLVYICLNAFSVYVKNKRSTTLAPLVAFSLLLLSNILSVVAFATREELIVIVSRLIYIAGLYVFLWLALKVVKSP